MGRYGCFRTSLLMLPVLPLLPFLLCGSVRSPRLRIEAMGWILVEEYSRNVRPELLDFRAQGALEGDRQTRGDGMAGVALFSSG